MEKPTSKLGINKYLLRWREISKKNPENLATLTTENSMYQKKVINLSSKQVKFAIKFLSKENKFTNHIQL